GEGGEWGEAGRFGRNGEWLRACGEHSQAGAGTEQPLCQLRAGVDEVFAIIEDKQEVAIAKRVEQRVGDRAAGRFRNVEPGREMPGEKPPVAQVRELDPCNAVSPPDFVSPGDF